MINIAELISDQDFAQSYTVTRYTGTYVGGRFVSTPQTLSFLGPVIAANVQDINMVPEGDRVNGLMVFYTTSDNPFLLSRNSEGQLGTSDEPNWRGEAYRVLQCYDYVDFGYQKVIGTRKAGK